MEISHKKAKISLTVPDMFTGKHYVAYFDVMEETAERYKGQKFLIRSYLAGLAICSVATWDGKDLKAAGFEDIPMRVISWVANRIGDYLNKEMEIPEA